MALEPLGEGWVRLVERACFRLHEQGFPVPRGSAAPLTRSSDPALVDAIVRYLDAVAIWNQKTDLTAARSAEELVDLSLGDACVVASSSPAPAPVRERWVDVGAGAGAPGLLTALIRPGTRMTLVEPRDRRVAFLRTVIGQLALGSVDVVRVRSAALPAGSFDVALSRATLPPPEWLAEGARLAASVWVLLAREEAPQRAGLSVVHDARYEWPLTNVPRRAVRYAKEPRDGSASPVR